MLEQPLPERISFIRGFLQSKSLRWGKRPPLLGAPPPLRGSGLVSAGFPFPQVTPCCISSFTRCRQSCRDPVAVCGKESFPMDILAGARACKGSPGGEGEGAGGCSGDAALGQHSSPGA